MSAPSFLPEDKTKAREVATERRRLVHERQGAEAAQGLLSHAFPVASQGQSCIAGYFPAKSEIDVRPLLAKCAVEKWVTALPVVVEKSKPLAFRRWAPPEPTRQGAMKIEEPLQSAPFVVPDVLLVPLLAFDRNGFRLGYGGGFYDLTLAALRARQRVVAIGVAYAGQEVASVPHEVHDQRLDYVMTEKEVFKCV